MTTPTQNTPTPEQIASSRKLGELMAALHNQVPDWAGLYARCGMTHMLEIRPTLAYAGRHPGGLTDTNGFNRLADQESNGR